MPLHANNSAPLRILLIDVEPGAAAFRSSSLTAADEGRIDPAVVAALYLKHADELRRFLIGLLGDPQLANDVLQAAFSRMVEQGHETKEESRKAWLFRVAYHEAMAIRRRQAVGAKAVQRLAWSRPAAGQSAEEPLLRFETVERVRAALDQLPPEQQTVVRMRIYEEKRFAEIAEELGIPLGTALGRMRAALQKLRGKLQEE